MTKALLVMFGLVLLIPTPPVLIGWITRSYPFKDVLVLFILDAAVISGYWFASHNHIALASQVPTAISFSLAVYYTYTTGLLTSGLLLYGISILLSAMLLGIRAQVLISGLSLVAHLMIGDLRFPIPFKDFVSVSVTITAALLGFVFLQWFFLSQLKTALDRIKNSERKIHNLFDRVPIGLYRTTPDGQILDANPALCEMLGYPDKESLLKVNVFDLYAQKTIRQGFITEVDRTKVSINHEMQLRRKDGDLIWVRDSTRAIEDEDGKTVFYEGSLENVTTSKNAEQSLKRQLEELRLLYTVSAMSAETNDEDKIIAHTTKALWESLYPDHIGVLLLDEEKKVLIVHPSYRGIQTDDFHRIIPIGKGVSGVVAENAEAIRVEDTTKFPGFIAITPGIHSELCVPIVVHNRVLGVINVESKVKNAFTDEDERLLTTVAGQLATAVEKVRLLKETQNRYQHMLALRKIDQAITGNLDLHPVLEVLLEEVLHQLKVDAAVILLYNPRLQVLDFAARLGFHTGALRDSHLALGEGFAGEAALKKQIIYVRDLMESKGDLTRAAHLSLEGFISYFAVPLVAKGQVKGVLELFNRSQLEPDQEWMDFLEGLATQAAIAIDNAELFENLQKANIDLIRAYDSTIEGWSRALDMRDKETEGHSQRVTELTLRLARTLKVKDSEYVHIRRGALLHDIGKMGVPDVILHKPGPLTAEEWEIMRRHPSNAYELLSPINFLRPALEIPYCHHEKWDGTGYPNQLKEGIIPLAARIFAVVDVWDALRSERPYRPAWSDEKAIDYLQKQSGAHFDPQIIQAFLEMIEGGKCTLT